MDELNLHANKVADDHVQPLLATIFRLGDELDVLADEAKGFSIGDNRLRIHWLLRRLTLERFDLTRRSAILMAACETAALRWLVDFASSAYEDYHPRPGKPPEQESQCLTTSGDAEVLRDIALSRIREAAQTGELCAHPRLAYLLYRWRDFSEDDGVEVRRWSDEQLARDEIVVKFAKASTSHGWSQSVNDVVAQQTTLANVENLELSSTKSASARASRNWRKETHWGPRRPKSSTNFSLPGAATIRTRTIRSMKQTRRSVGRDDLLA